MNLFFAPLRLILFLCVKLGVLPFILILLLSTQANAELKPKVFPGIDCLVKHPSFAQLKGRRIGILSNHTAVNSQGKLTIDILKEYAKSYGFTVTALFAPEHGIYGSTHASEWIVNDVDSDGIPIYSLYGKSHRPTPEMLKQIDVLIYDIQDLGTRSYTYANTLFYAMEEAAKHSVSVMILDRPNPINGIVIDGPMLENQLRSIVGYINVPYCHGMTIGELAQFFNSEYNIGCSLLVVPMQGWQRTMSFNDTGLLWIPTSPHVPEASTALFYPMTGILGELSIVNIGVGYTLPFKLLGAPWIDARQFADALNAQKFAGVLFEPFHFKPFYGKFANEECHGVLLAVTDPLRYKPVSTLYLMVGMLKSLYPEQFGKAIKGAEKRRAMFAKVNGSEEPYRLIVEEKYIAWKLCALHKKERERFLQLRKKYLIADYYVKERQAG